MAAQIESYNEDTSILTNLFKSGVLATNDQGEINVINDPNEQMRIANSFANV